MDVILLLGNAIRLKGKNSSVVINPTTSTNKSEADSILILDPNIDFSDAKIENSRITFKGPGEYEVGGIKISSIAVGDKFVGRINVDNVNVLVGGGDAIEKIQEKVEGSDIIVLNADTKFNYSVLTSLEPKVLLVFGELKEEVSKSIGKTLSESTNKFSTTADKLPAEMQYFILG